MTAEEKTILSNFLDIALDYFHSGYKQKREAYTFTDDTESAALPAGAALNNKTTAGIENGDFSANDNSTNDYSTLPLAYRIDENEDSGDDSLENVNAQIRACADCPLGTGRTNTVPGEGVENPLVMIVGEGPGADEDASGRPFVGKAGQLLDKMLASVGLYRGKNCFIANAVKCRPPGNRNPAPEEIEACAAFLDRQIQILKPLVILCAGGIAAKRILKSEGSLTSLRGRFGEYKGIPVLPTYHPSALLRDESYKRPSWEDLKMLKARLSAMNEEYAAAFKDD